jgi:hypothetical protein
MAVLYVVPRVQASVAKVLERLGMKKYFDAVIVSVGKNHFVINSRYNSSMRAVQETPVRLRHTVSEFKFKLNIHTSVPHEGPGQKASEFKFKLLLPFLPRKNGSVYFHRVDFCKTSRPSTSLEPVVERVLLCLSDLLR